MFSISDDPSGTNHDYPQLHNHVVFSGLVSGKKQSNNHAFGIIYLNVKRTNKREFSDTLPTARFPYRLENGKAEIYTMVSGVETGDSVQLKSDSETVYYFHFKPKVKDKGGQ